MDQGNLQLTDNALKFAKEPPVISTKMFYRR